MIPAQKRIMTELPEIEKIYNKIQITFTSTPSDNPSIHIHLYDPHYNELKRIIPKELDIILTKNYPFKPPEIVIKNKKYMRTIPHNGVIEYRRKMPNIILPFKEDCLHCYFITKQENWSPRFCIKDIIKQIEELEKTKQIIFHKVFLERFNIPNELSNTILSFIHPVHF
jgi:hypothetical protein